MRGKSCDYSAILWCLGFSWYWNSWQANSWKFHCKESFRKQRLYQRRM